MVALNKYPRRAILRGALLGAAGTASGAVLSACTDPPTADPAPASAPPVTEPRGAPASSSARNGTVLLAYFSRAGENYFNGGRKWLSVGNTEVVAGMISRLIGCDVHPIEAADPYPGDYESTVARNVEEQNANARPGIANSLASIDRYDTILLGSPIWNVRAPMIMTTFVDGFDFARQDDSPAHHLRDERPGKHRARLRRLVPRCDVGAGPGRARRGGRRRRARR